MSGIDDDDDDDDENIQNLLQIRLLYFSFTIPRKVIFKGFAYFLRIVNLRKKSLLVKTISITCTIPFFFNLIFIDVVPGTILKENSCSESLYKTEEVTNEGFFS